MEQHSCLTFAVDCGVMFKGVGVVIAGFVLFVGSVYMLLTAVFGRYMAYLVAVAFFGWMTTSPASGCSGSGQGPGRTNLGPRGPERRGSSTPPGWIRGGAWELPPTRAERIRTSTADSASRRPASRAGRRHDVPGEPGERAAQPRPARLPALQPTQFTVDDLRFVTAEDGTSSPSRSALPQADRNALNSRCTATAKCPLLADLRRLGDPADRAHPAVGSRRTISQGIPGRRHRAALVRTGLGGGTMLHLLTDVPLFDQGAVQFILLTVMIVVVAFLIWLTIPR